MTLNQIKYVIEVAETGSINKAAGNFFISQSVLSNAIQSLESELGNEIFSRSTRGTSLTPFGKTFLAYVMPIQAQFNQLDKVLFNKKRDYRRRLSLVTNGFYFTSEICSKLFQKYHNEGIHITQYEGFGNEAMLMVASGSAEIGLVRQWSCYHRLYASQYEAMKIQFCPIVTLDIAITVGPKNPLYLQKSEFVTPEMLKPYPMIMYDYMDSGPFSDIMEHLHLPSNISRMVTSSRSTIYEVLANTNAYYLNSNYTPVQQKCCDHTTPYKQRILILKNCTIKSELGWIKRIDSPVSPTAQEAIGMFYEYLTEEYM